MQMQKKSSSIVPVIILLCIFFGFLFFFKSKKQTIPIPSAKNSFYKQDTLQKIASDAEFTELFSTNNISSTRDLPMSAGRSELGAGQSVERASGTNVQVFGVDEPDIVKTDNTSIYYSRQGQYRYLRNNGISPDIELQNIPLSSSKMMPPQYQQTSEVVAVNALPPSAMKMQSSIPTSGEMLISDKVLVVFATNSKGSLQLEGYSISDPTAPKKIWELPFSNRSQKVGARLYKNALFLVTSTTPTMPQPCPLPLIEGKMNLKLKMQILRRC